MGICFKLMIGDGCVAMFASFPFTNMESTMPTHACTMYKTRGLPLVLPIFFACVGIVLAQCWHASAWALAAQAQRIKYTRRQEIFAMILYIIAKVLLNLYIWAKGCDMEFSRSSKFFSRFFHHKFKIPCIRHDFFSIHINFFMRIQ